VWSRAGVCLTRVVRQAVWWDTRGVSLILHDHLRGVAWALAPHGEVWTYAVVDHCTC